MLHPRKETLMLDNCYKAIVSKLYIQGIVIAREFGSRGEECTTATPMAYAGRLEEIYISLHQLLDSKDTQVPHSF